MQAIDELESTGLSNYNARAYYALLAFGKQTGREVSNNSKIPPTKVFDVLRKLEESGLAEKVQQKPMAWTAIKPEIGIKVMLDRKIASYSELEKRLLSTLKNVKVEPEEHIYEGVTVITGFKEVFSVVAEYYRHAMHTALVFSAGEIIPTEVEVETARAIRRGVNVRMIATEYSDKNRELLRGWVRDGWTIRSIPGSKEFTFAVFDKKVSIIMVKSPKEKNERIFIALENPDLSAAFSDYYEVLWKRAQPVS